MLIKFNTIICRVYDTDCLLLFEYGDLLHFLTALLTFNQFKNRIWKRSNESK